MSLAEVNISEFTNRPTKGEIEDVDVPQERAEVRHSATHAVAKRTLDVVCALTLLLLTAPLLAVITLLVRRDGGPALFRQRRIGRGGDCFPVLKFRSMAVDAEERLRRDPALYRRYLANDFKLPADEDPRTTRLGCFLRSSSLDELPQLFNVLRGEMSMVGPRPIVEDELREYTSREAEDAYLCARPGLTGIWQATGRSTVGYETRVALDIAYVAEPSIWTDVKLLLLTVVAVIRRSGAY